LDPHSNRTIVREQQPPFTLSLPPKQCSESVSTDEGITIEFSAEQFENVDFPITCSFEPGSNTTVESAMHERKHESERIVTDEGMRMDGSDRQPAKAKSPIPSRLDRLSKTTPESDVQSLKHELPICPAEAGIAIRVRR
jgi:hypothetical protein